MKTKTIIESISYEGLVDFLSTALCGNEIFGSDYNTEVYDKCPDKSDEECFEDKLARILLNGGCITISDCYAEDEDEFYGSLKHSWDDEYEAMDYSVDISDIKKGLQNCIDGTFNGSDSTKSYIRRCVTELINHEDGNLDLPEASDLLQVVIFGELIYG